MKRGRFWWPRQRCPSGSTPGALGSGSTHKEGRTGESKCIWFVSKYAEIPDPGEPAGRAYGLSRAFKRSGHNPVIVTSDLRTPAMPASRRRWWVWQSEGIEVCVLRTLKYSDSRSVRRILSWLDFERRLLLLPRDILPSPDAIVVSSLSLLTVLNGVRLRRRHRCRLVFEVRDIWPLTLIDVGGFSAGNPLIRLLAAIERFGYLSADAVVGSMPNLGPHVQEVTGKAIETHCIPQGVDVVPPASDGKVQEPQGEVFATGSGFQVGYAGTIGAANALDVVFGSAERTIDDHSLRYVLLGDGPLREQLIARYGHMPNVEFVPAVARSQVLAFLRGCDLLVWPTHHHSIYQYGVSPNKLMDYMLAGRPIVACYSGYRSMIDEADCGTFVPAGDAAALANEILRYRAMSQTEREEIGRRGRAWVETNRSFDTLAEAYLKLITAERGRTSS